MLDIGQGQTGGSGDVIERPSRRQAPQHSQFIRVQRSDGRFRGRQPAQLPDGHRRWWMNRQRDAAGVRRQPPGDTLGQDLRGRAIDVQEIRSKGEIEPFEHFAVGAEHRSCRPCFAQQRQHLLQWGSGSKTLFLPNRQSVCIGDGLERLNAASRRTGDQRRRWLGKQLDQAEGMQMTERVERTLRVERLPHALGARARCCRTSHSPSTFEGSARTTIIETRPAVERTRRFQSVAAT